MSRRFLIFGVGLLLWGAVWLVAAGRGAAQIERGGPAPTRTPVLPTVEPGATPTPDRLAPPPTSAVPNQADEGAQLYWLHCQPCHGDRGQGLTDEWRAQYPPEEEYCWESGCHGPQPYDQAFALPTSVPPVIANSESGVTTVLQKFETMEDVYQYVSAAMPYFFPGELTQEEYLAITAHLARENGLWDGTMMTPETLANYRLRPPAATSTGGHLALPSVTPDVTTGTGARAGADGRVAGLIGLGVAVLALAAIGGMALWRNRRR